MLRCDSLTPKDAGMLRGARSLIDVVVLPSMAHEIHSVEDGQRLIWPLLADAFAHLWDLPEPPSPERGHAGFRGPSEVTAGSPTLPRLEPLQKPRWPAGRGPGRPAAGSCGSGARDPEPEPGPMPGAGPGQKSDGVFRKMVTRVAAWLHSATIATARRPMRASGPPAPWVTVWFIIPPRSRHPI